MDVSQNVTEFLESNGIEYVLHEHSAVFTTEEAHEYCGDIPGMACKNLFLRSRKGDRYFLLVMPADKRADLKKTAELMGEKKISFASPDRLKEKLGLEPGSVSPFGLLNDKEKIVEVYVDEEVYDADIVGFHPNRNTATLELTGEMFRKFLETIDHKIHTI